LYSSNLISSLNDLESDLRTVLIQKDKKRHKKILDHLNLVLLNTYNEAAKETLRTAIDYLLSKGNAKFNESHSQAVNKILNEGLGENLRFKPVLGVAITDLYKGGINDVLKPAKVKFSFKLADQNAAEVLTNHTMFWSRHFYSTYVNDKIDEALKDYFTSDKPIKEVANDLQSRFKNVSKKNSSSYFKGLAEFTSNRVRELGKVTGFEKGGIKSYKIVAKIDERTSKVCRKLNGLIIPVKSAINYRDKIISLKSPEDVKKFSPWLSDSKADNLDTSKLPPGLSLPPYHWRCRTQAVANFS
jgi:SPP1 gp7 family putative phage head morphogenesis protein